MLIVVGPGINEQVSALSGVSDGDAVVAGPARYVHSVPVRRRFVYAQQHAIRRRTAFGVIQDDDVVAVPAPNVCISCHETVYIDVVVVDAASASQPSIDKNNCINGHTVDENGVILVE